MNPVRQLSKILRRGRSTQGTVQEIVGDTAMVSTRAGVKSLSIPAGLSLALGDRVRVESDTITGRLRQESELPVYIV